MILGRLNDRMAEAVDKIDLRLLACLLEDSALSQRALAERVGLSQNACWRRLKRLRSSGVIKGYTLKLDHAALGLDVAAIVMIRTRHHSTEWLTAFRSHVRSIPEVVDFYRIAGDYDYTLKIICRSMGDLDRVYRRLISTIEIDTVTSYLAMEVIEEQRPLAIAQLERSALGRTPLDAP